MDTPLKNYRDVGASINKIVGSDLLNEGVLFRSGRIDDFSNMSSNLPVRSILNLRRSVDPLLSPCIMLQAAPAEKMNNYLCEEIVFRDWIQRVYSSLISAEWPILVHCESGKDRTGVVIGLLLNSIEVPQRAIVHEYLRSSGKCYPESLQSVLAKSDTNSVLRVPPSLLGHMKKKLLVGSSGKG